MVKLSLFGQEYPLALTVAAVGELAKDGIPIAKIPTMYQFGKGRTIDDAVNGSLRLAELLNREGCEYLAIRGEAGCLLDMEQVRKALTPADVLFDIAPVLDKAVAWSLVRTIEAEPAPKNAERAV